MKPIVKEFGELNQSMKAMSDESDGQVRKDSAMLETKDAMTKQVICIGKDTPILEAVKLMASNNVTGIPVVEDDMTLIGILSEQDVLRLFQTFDDEKDGTVNDFMTQPAIHFEEDERLLDVCYCLRDNSIRRVPVTCDGKVVGVISRSDIIKCILQQAGHNVVQTAGEPS